MSRGPMKRTRTAVNPRISEEGKWNPHPKMKNPPLSPEDQKKIAEWLKTNKPKKGPTRAR